jgi:hypothetical protein
MGAVTEGPEACPLGEPTWAGAINRDSVNRPRIKAVAQRGHWFDRSAAFPQGLKVMVGACGVGKSSAGVACDSDRVPSAAAGIDYSRVEGWPGALRTTVTQNLICTHYPPVFSFLLPGALNRL